LGREAQVASSAALALVVLALIGAAAPACAQPRPARGPDETASEEAGRLAQEQEQRAREHFREASAAALKQSAADLAKTENIVCIRADRLDALIDRLTQDAKTLGDLVSLSDAYGGSFSGDGAVRVRRARVLDAVKRLRAQKCPPPDAGPQAPPPKAPPSTPSAPPSPAPQTRALTPTHRIAHCAPCQADAKALNDTADRYADAVRRNDPAEIPLREDMAKLAKALDACERVCHMVARPPPSEPPGIHLAPPR
jgi:hypothetical protein